MPKHKKGSGGKDKKSKKSKSKGRKRIKDTTQSAPRTPTPVTPPDGAAKPSTSKSSRPAAPNPAAGKPANSPTSRAKSPPPKTRSTSPAESVHPGSKAFNAHPPTVETEFVRVTVPCAGTDAECRKIVILNTCPERLTFKIKCTKLDQFLVEPGMGFIEGMCKCEVLCQPKPIATNTGFTQFDHFAVLLALAPQQPNLDAQDVWKSGNPAKPSQVMRFEVPIIVTQSDDDQEDESDSEQSTSLSDSDTQPSSASSASASGIEDAKRKAAQAIVVGAEVVGMTVGAMRNFFTIHPKLAPKRAPASNLRKPKPEDVRGEDSDDDESSGDERDSDSSDMPGEDDEGAVKVDKLRDRINANKLVTPNATDGQAGTDDSPT